MNDHAPQGGARNDRAHAPSDPRPESLRRARAASVPAAHWPAWTDRHRYAITRQLGRREGQR